VNKAQLIDALAERLGDRKVAAAAVAGLIDVVVRTVNADDRVTITGFGVFEKRARAARTARNPRTGQAVTVQQTDVPVFRPGALFREVVSGTRALPAAGVSSMVVTARQSPTSQQGAGSVPINQPASANSRPVTRAAAATHLSAVQAAPTKMPKAAKAAKVTNGAKAPKAAKSAPKAVKAAAKPMKVKKGEAKNVTKASTKIIAKKALKKTTGKKSAAK
jgi:DNA-binding protein HU-beta